MITTPPPCREFQLSQLVGRGHRAGGKGVRTVRGQGALRGGRGNCPWELWSTGGQVENEEYPRGAD